MGRWLRLAATMLAIATLLALVVVVATSCSAPLIDPVPPIAMVTPNT